MMIRTAEDTYDPDTTRYILDLLKEIAPEYSIYSLNLINCLESLSADLFVSINNVFLNPKEDSSKVCEIRAKIIAKYIKEIHQAIDCDDVWRMDWEED